MTDKNPVAEIVAEVSAEMRPSPAADKLIEQAQAAAPAGAVNSPETPAGDSGGAASPVGETFDPAIHEAGPDGGPVFCADGTMRRRRGRKPVRGPDGKFTTTGPAEPAAPAEGSSPPAAPADLPANAVSSDEARAAATATVAVIVSLGSMLGGDEWRPLSGGENPAGVDEFEHMTTAWEQYYLAAGVANIPPWAGAAIATGMYIVPRLSKPKTAGRIQAFVGWLKGLAGRVRV